VLRTARQARHPSTSELEVHVETLDLAGKELATWTGKGAFHAWFSDGSHLITLSDTHYRVYDAAGQEVRSIPAEPDPLPQEREWPTVSQWGGGSGDFFWLYRGVRWSRPDLPFSNETRFYRLSDPSWTKTREGPGPTEGEDGTLAYRANGGPAQRIDLRGEELQVADLPVPGGSYYRYASDAAGWSVSLDESVYDVPRLGATEPRHVLGCGGLQSLTGSRAGRVMINTTYGKLRIVDTQQTVREPPGMLDIGRGTPLHLSADGQVLFARRPLRALALPDGEVIHTWPEWPESGRHHFTPTVSPDSERVARRACVLGKTLSGVDDALGQCSLEVTTRAGTPLFETASFLMGGHIRFSPSGRRIAVGTDERRQGRPEQILVFEADKLVGDFSGTLQGWLDEERLLVTEEKAAAGVKVIDLQGQVLSTLHLDAFRGPTTTVDGEHILSVDTLYRVSDGAVLQHVPNASHVALAGDEILFSRSGRIFRRPLR
jgi:hypothetical protein